MADTKLIVNNALVLYLRSFLSLAISLYVSRLVLKYLGAEGLGVYSAIGGVVALFAFIQSSMASASQRFLAFYIGKNNNELLKKVFSMCVNIHVLISLALIGILEIGGLIYINHYFNYGTISIFEVNVVFQTSVISLFFLINCIPYNSLLIARESMKAYAYLDILNRLLNLIGVMFLCYVPLNYRLSLYACLLLFLNILINICYMQICKCRFEESHYVKCWDKGLFKDLFSYTGFVTLPALVSIAKTQGVVLLLNSVYGPVINAAQGIANQMNNAIRMFSNNIGVAFSPQITISCSRGEYETMEKLYVLGSKNTFSLFLLCAIPLILKMNFFLEIWLGNVPTYTVTIASLILIDTLISSMTSCFNTAIRATGNIKYYEIVYNTFHLVGIFIIVLYIHYGCNYYTPYVILAILSYISMGIQLYCMKRVLMGMSIRYVLSSILKMTIVGALAYICSLIISSYFTNSIIDVVIFVLCSTIINAIFIYVFGMDKKEREKVFNIVKSLFFKK